MQVNITEEQLVKKLKIKGLNKLQLEARKHFDVENNLILKAPTGSGKTLAFIWSLLPKLSQNEDGIQALIIAPTRELVQQIEQVFKEIGTGLKINSTYGGHSMRVEVNNFSVLPSVLIGTPGRLLDHIRRENIDISTVETLILDEFDKSLEMGFEEDMKQILERISSLKYRLLVSATDLQVLPDFVGNVDFSKLEVETEFIAKEQSVILVNCEHREKEEALFELLCNLPTDKTIIFCNHRELVLKIHEFLNDGGIHSVYYHGGLEQDDRERALIKFKNGSSNYLVSTDLAARGLDISEVAHVIHFQFPINEETYTHRNGRTSRQAHEGHVFILKSKEEYLPDYIRTTEEFGIVDKEPLPDPPLWKTIYIGGGKKDKINKVDVVGFLHKIGGIENNDIGMITVQDRAVLVAINTYVVEDLVRNIRDEKIKGKRFKIGFAR